MNQRLETCAENVGWKSNYFMNFIHKSIWFIHPTNWETHFHKRAVMLIYRLLTMSIKMMVSYSKCYEARRWKSTINFFSIICFFFVGEKITISEEKDMEDFETFTMNLLPINTSLLTNKSRKSSKTVLGRRRMVSKRKRRMVSKKRNAQIPDSDIYRCDTLYCFCQSISKWK